MPGHIGFPAYCQALAMLPATNAQIAEAIGMKPAGVCGMMRRFWQLRLVYPAKLGRRNAVVWAKGQGVEVQSPKIAGKVRPYANHIVFASMVRELEEAMTTRQLADATGVSLIAAQVAIRHMRAAGLVRVAEWCADGAGRPCAKYELGRGKDVPKPAPQCNRVKWARYMERKGHKALQFGLPSGAACT